MESEETTAYHEAGHALMALLEGGRVVSVTIEPDRDDGPERTGDVQIEWDLRQYDDRTFAETAVRVALAGPVAEMIYEGDPYHPGLVGAWALDWQQAWLAAAILHSDERRRLAYLEQATAQLHRRLSEDRHWAALAAIVDHLLAHQRLDAVEVEEIVRTWLG